MKIGLVLSGGGARGFAHLGILKVLKETNINFDAIAGCSIGAIIGACYAFDQDPERIKQLLLTMKSKRDIYDFSFSTKGLIKGNKLEEYIIGYFKNENIKFEDLKIELSINATDIVHGEEVVFNSGPLIPAIMASVSYPGFFTTRKIADRLCVDGGVVNPLPVDLLPEVDYAIIIDVSSQDMEINQDSNIKDLVLQSTWTMQKIIAEKSIESYKKPYIILKPDVTRIGVLDFKNSERIIKTGEEEALKRIDKIKEDLK